MVIKWRYKFLFFLCVATSITTAHAAVVRKEVEQALNRKDRVPVLIQLATDGLSLSRHRIAGLQTAFSESIASTALPSSDFAVSQRLKRLPWLSAKISARALEKLRVNRLVSRIEADMVVHAQLSESGPLIHSDFAHNEGFTGAGVTVAVIDTGMDTDHPDLQGDLIREECFLSGGSCPQTGTSRASGPGSAEDDQGHGTHVSGIITSDNTVYRGVAQNAGIVAIKILDNAGEGMMSDVVAAIDWVIDNQATYNIRIINMSLGGDVYGGLCDTESTALAEAASAAKNNGIVLFAAAGNDGSTDGISSPACLSSVISVGAVYDADLVSASFGTTCTDTGITTDQIACFSNTSPVLDLLAPGARITSMNRLGGVISKSGTSMACPHVAATAALLLEDDPGLSPDNVLAILKSTGKPIYDQRIDQPFPRIDASAALGINSHTDPDPPVIETTQFAACVSESTVSAIHASAMDPAGGELVYEWLPLDGGEIIGSGSSVVFDPPAAGPHPCPYRIRLTVTSNASHLSTQTTMNITVTLSGDANKDGVVNILDKVAVRNAFGLGGTPGWIPADVNADGVVNILDKVIVRNQFGWTGCACE